jgi:hypothetical protein
MRQRVAGPAGSWPKLPAANAAAIKVLRRCSAVLVFDGSQVYAEIPSGAQALPLTPESDG